MDRHAPSGRVLAKGIAGAPFNHREPSGDRTSPGGLVPDHWRGPALDRFESRTGSTHLAKASPRKARRRGLRRTTSALTTTILGAALTASTVSAQQYPAVGQRRTGRLRRVGVRVHACAWLTSASSSEARPGTNTDPIVGMAATRGARYLLRNGLDYINYQEYERAPRNISARRRPARRSSTTPRGSRSSRRSSGPSAAFARPSAARLPMH